MVEKLTERFLDKVIRRRALENIGMIIAFKAKELVSKDLGMLRDSIDWKVTGDRVVIGTNSSYAIPMEYGRLPGKMPPVEPLKTWAKRHGMPGAEWAIAQNIKKKGIKAGTPENPLKTASGFRPFLRPALLQSREEIKQAIRDAFKGK